MKQIVVVDTTETDAPIKENDESTFKGDPDIPLLLQFDVDHFNEINILLSDD